MMGYANNIIPVWLIVDECPSCNKKVKPRDEYPGINCTECGGNCVLEEEE